MRGLVVSLGVYSGLAQSARFEDPVVRTDGSIELRLAAPADRTLRIEVSTNLMTWTQVATLTNNPKVFVDTPAGSYRFYRALEEGGATEPGFRITDILPAAAAPGSEIAIQGVFTLPPNDTDKFVRFGSALAEVRQASATEWRVVVPELAGSGPIQLLTATTNAQSDEAFTVLATAPVTLVPPSGMSAADFTIVNTFGGTVTSNGPAALRVRTDTVTIHMAADRTTNRFLYAVSLSGANPIVLSSDSTADTFVFLAPPFATSDSLLAARTLELIRQNPKVREFGALLAQLYPQAGDPFTNPVVKAKFEEAVRSVAGLPEMAGLAKLAVPDPGLQKLQQITPSGDYPLDIEYISLVNDDDGKPLGPFARKTEAGVGPAFPYLNPVDWLVVVQEINTDAAFPEGKIDFDKAWREKKRLEKFPIKPGFTGDGSVEANLITERFNPVKFGVKKFSELILDAIFPKDSSIQFPQGNGVYVLRAIGPGINDSAEVDFTLEQYQEQRVRAIAANLVAVVMDLVSLLIDLETIEFEGARQEIIAKTTLEVYKAVPGLKKPADLGPLALGLVKFLLQEISDKAVGAGIEAGAKKIAAKGAETLAKNLNIVGATLSVTDKLGGAGQVFQRELGLLVTTPMETALIMIGEPFKIDPVTIEPALAAPGDEVRISFQSSALRRMFDPAVSTDAVAFEGTEAFMGEVLEVTGTTNSQTLRVRVPVTLNSRADGFVFGLCQYAGPPRARGLPNRFHADNHGGDAFGGIRRGR